LFRNLSNEVSLWAHNHASIPREVQSVAELSETIDGDNIRGTSGCVEHIF
jgi:hypothetical protein